MNYSENDNIYEFNAREVLAKYADFVEGTPECMVAVCFGGALSVEARGAVAASCAKLELGECAWVDAVGAASAGGVGAGAESGPGSANANRSDLFELIEGLDPVALIAADGAAAEALSAAYKRAIQQDAANRLFGRTCIAFRSFESMLADSDSKQRAWALLKQLAR